MLIRRQGRRGVMIRPRIPNIGRDRALWRPMCVVRTR